MVKGIGVDSVEISRVRRLVKGRRSDSFIVGTFTENELDYILGDVNHFATTFASKEAVFKAFGIGLGNPLDVEVIRLESGVPTIRFHGELMKIAKKRKISRALVSLSFTEYCAHAFVVLL